ncbi:MAG: hypothetical protein JWM80_479 [Cyanobacteria bacterium RYN_339]|nr:hypothetical protein [Cyanobacteria bacterium RYN_339]
MSKAALALLPIVLLAACDIKALPPLAAPALTIMGKGTEVRMRPAGTKIYRSDIVDLTTQRPVSDTQVSGHFQFEVDATKTDPTVTVIGQDNRERTIKLKGLGAVDYATVALTSIPVDTGMGNAVAGGKVNDVLLFKVADSHKGTEFGKLILRVATSEKVAFDYTLNTDGLNNNVVCPTPSPSSSSFTITLPTVGDGT